MSTGSKYITNVSTLVEWLIKEGTDIKMQTAQTFDDIAVTTGGAMTYTIAKSSSLTLATSNFGIAGASAAFVMMTNDNDVTSFPTIEVNNSGVADTFKCWVYGGDAGITQVEIANTDSTYALNITVMFAA